MTTAVETLSADTSARRGRIARLAVSAILLVATVDAATVFLNWVDLQAEADRTARAVALGLTELDTARTAVAAETGAMAEIALSDTHAEVTLSLDLGAASVTGLLALTGEDLVLASSHRREPSL